MAGPDRLQLLLAQSHLTGIDFVDVHPDQTKLDVYFHVDPASLSPSLVGAIPSDAITLRGEPGERLEIVAIGWPSVAGRTVLRIEVASPGDFHPYTLTLGHPQIDPRLNGVSVSFKAACPSDIDCRPPDPGCEGDAPVDFAVDYLARDFESLRRGLLDFASQRYPRWTERAAPDVAVMLAEVMAALGDELAYAQDRIGREGYIESATQRRSARRHFRLVDYELADALGASTFVDLTCTAAGVVRGGDPIWSSAEDGTRIHFEIGRGLADHGVPYGVDPARNRLVPHRWDESEVCVRAGATELWVEGHHAGSLPLDDAPPGRPPGRWIALVASPADPAIPERRWLARLVEVRDETDPLIAHPVHGHDVTYLRWEADHALPFDVPIIERTSAGTETIVLELRGNMVPATAGRTAQARFVVGPSFEVDGDELAEAVERTGPGGSTALRWSLPETDRENLVWTRAGDGSLRPEVALVELREIGGTYVPDRSWTWRRSLVGSPAAQPEDACFSLEDGTWARVVGYRRLGREVTHIDYLSGAGFSIRFGDGEFGRVPGAPTVFETTFRLGGGGRTNVGAGTLRHFDTTLWPHVERATNPMPATGGRDPETLESARADAPEAYRYITYRAVRPEDYAEAAERLPWVQRAGAAFRWTGSWLTAFVTPDPRDVAVLEADARIELENHLERFRQAGRDVRVQDPRYADLDVEVVVCVDAAHRATDVRERVRRALDGEGGFFDPDNFTFGTPLDRAALEAAVQRVAGVRAVEGIRVRRRGRFGWRRLTERRLLVAANEVVRVESDPDHPSRGSVVVTVRGGA